MGVCLVLLAALVVGPAWGKGLVNPEDATGHHDKPLAWAPHYMASTANPLATQTAVDILRAGGSAADAAIAAQWVLSLVEPQSSGLGGGGFIVTFDQAKNALHTYDARETAPAAATPERFETEGHALPFWTAVNSGLSVGVPGLVAGMARLHEREGRLPWARLLQPAIQLARDGFAVSPRLHKLLQGNQALRQSPDAAAFFYDANGKAWPVGHVLRNPRLARVLRKLAAQGPKAFYTGPVAQDIVQAVGSHKRPGNLSLDDLRAYRVVERPALCTRYGNYQLCGMGPPSSGPLSVMQILKTLQHTPILQFAPNSLQAVHYFSEAGRLACADRSAYVADPDFVNVPVRALLNEDYLRSRAQLIQRNRAIAEPRAGRLPDQPTPARDATPELPSTTHVVVVDAKGNVVSMTNSVESAFGSKIFVDGFLLNNQLTDFALSPRDRDGRWRTNRVESGKRPRSSMSPMIVMREGKPYMAIGAPGGPAIVNYVAKTLLGVMGWGLDIQSAIALPNRGGCSHGTSIEQGTALEQWAGPLRHMGHSVDVTPMPSGLAGIVMTPNGLWGGADPRREGVARGG
jgi:gamma-glutamyltranspeptidase/glutathione hydrolase